MIAGSHSTTRSGNQTGILILTKRNGTSVPVKDKSVDADESETGRPLPKTYERLGHSHDYVRA